MGARAPLLTRRSWADPEIEIVLDLTPPYVHHEIDMAALGAGKNVHREAPGGRSGGGAEPGPACRREAARLGAAPGHRAGWGIQTCRRLIDDGAIGTPIGANAWMMGHGSENWHPDPEFFYKRGGGPLLDMGPYYDDPGHPPRPREAGHRFEHHQLPRASHHERAGRGQRITVECPTHVNGVLRVRQRRHRQCRDELRHLGHGGAVDRDLWHRGDAERSRTPTAFGGPGIGFSPRLGRVARGDRIRLLYW